MAVFPSRISASGLTCFLECPMQFKLRYLDKVKIQMGNIFMGFGTALHRAFAQNYTQKIISGVDLSIAEVEQKFCESLKQELEKVGDMRSYELMKLQGGEIINQYMREISPKINPLSVEQEFMIELKSVGVTIHGYIDLVTSDGFIIDHKSAGSTTYQKRTQKYVDNLMQLTMYALAYRKMYNKEETGVRIDVLKRLKGSVGIATIESKRTAQDVMVLAQLVGNVKKIVESDLRYPNLNHCPSCPYKDICNKMCQF